MRYVLDVETNSLIRDMCTFKDFPYKLRDDAKIWVVSLFNIDTEKQYTLVNEAITKDTVSEILKDCTELIAHNGFKFDFPILEMFGLITYTIDSEGNSTLNGNPCKFIDTLIWSRLFYPDRFGGHSLKAWGDRVSLSKIDYRLTLINKGKLAKDSPKGAEFLSFFPEMEEYCNNDVKVCFLIYQELLKESESKVWQEALKQENYLAYLSFYRENFGFGFDKELALNNLERLIIEMDGIRSKINPILPSRKLNKTEQKEFIPPKKQILKNGKLNNYIVSFAEKHKADIRLGDEGQWVFHYKDVKYDIPFSNPLETEIEADIDNLDHVKMYLISLGWEPTEWRERDLTKDSKKQNLPIQKRVAVLNRWWEETVNGKYKKQRLEYLNADEHELYYILKGKLSGSKPVRVPTSPLIRVGVTKDLCPNLLKLGEKVAFAKDFADYLTYKHRKSCIAGGDIDEMDFDEESPNTGYLSSYREEDGRIPTPAIEIGAACVTLNTKILTWNGLKNIQDVQIGDIVLTHDGTYQKITDLIDNGIKDVWEVTLDNGLSLRCTGNHPFYTDRGWIMCQELQDNEIIYHYGETEIWKGHPLFTKYEFSTWGGVRTTRNYIITPLESKQHGRSVTVDLYDGKGVKTRKTVGRAVLETFVGLNESLECRHLDGNTWNNNLKNLEYGTSKENKADNKLHGIVGSNRTKNKKIKLSSEQVQEIREYFKTLGKRGDDQILAKKYNVCRETIGQIRRNERWIIENEKFVDRTYREKFSSCKLKTIVYKGRESTLDITVENSHSYVANNIVTHNSYRYKHVGIANVPRVTSLFGEEMRGLFTPGKGFIQFGWDYSSLEARIMGHYVYKYSGGIEMANMLLAEKPLDWHCYDQETEILTEEGWKLFNDIGDLKVAQWENNVISFVKPINKLWQKYKGKMISFENGNISKLVTPNHRIVYTTDKDYPVFKTFIAEEALDSKFIYRKIPITGEYSGNLSLDKNLIKLIIATQADGSLEKDCSAITFGFKRKRKIERLLSILHELKANYTKTESKRGDTTIRLNSSFLTKEVRKYLTKEKEFDWNLINLTLEGKTIFKEELLYWDGNLTKKGALVVDSNKLQNSEIIQVISHLSGEKCTLNSFPKKTNFGEFICNRNFKAKKSRNFISLGKRKKIDYDGYIGCVTVPSSYIIVRRNNKIYVSGNSQSAIKVGINRTEMKSLNYACLPMDTRILTESGWKFFEDVQQGDVVLSYNTETDCIEKDTILKKHFFKDKEVFKYSNSHKTFRSTQDHRWFGWKREFQDKKRINRKTFFTMEKANQEYNMLLSAPYVGGNSSVTPDEAEFIGYLLSDGYFSWSKRSEKTSSSKGKRRQVSGTISQDINKFCNEIELCFKKLNCKYSVHTPKQNNSLKVYTIDSEWLREFLDRVIPGRKDKHETDWTSWVISLKRESLERFIYAFNLGDGYIKVTKNSIKIAQNQGNIFDGIITALQLLGSGAVSYTNNPHKCKKILKQNKRHITLQKIKKESLGVQNTFCLTTNNSTFIVWQDNFIGITGNCIYGAQPSKIQKMLACTNTRAKEIYNDAWDAMPALKELKSNLEEFWEKTGKKYIIGIDGRKIFTRSKHSLLNFLFQSAGVICTKYVFNDIFTQFQEKGLNISPFKGMPDVISMIEYHDECQFATKDFYKGKYQLFSTEEEAKEFVKSWKGGQLSAIGHEKDFFYIVKPNLISETIINSLDTITKRFDLKVPLSMEYNIGMSWAQCH